MTRTEIIERFRQENPEITANVVSDANLRSWLVIGDKETCAKARLLVSNDTIDTITGQAGYDLTELTNFYDIDENPGGGVSIVDDDGREKRLTKRSKSELDDSNPSWRTEASGTPKDYYRRGKYMYLRPSPSASMDFINIDYIAISDDFNDDNATPFNQLTHLEPFHYSLVLYLRMRAKSKVGKPEDAQTAMAEYDAYIKWMRKEIGGGKYGPISFRPSGVTPFRDRR